MSSLYSFTAKAFECSESESDDDDEKLFAKSKSGNATRSGSSLFNKHTQGMTGLKRNGSSTSKHALKAESKAQTKKKCISLLDSDTDTDKDDDENQDEKDEQVAKTTSATSSVLKTILQEVDEGDDSDDSDLKAKMSPGLKLSQDENCEISKAREMLERVKQTKKKFEEAAIPTTTVEVLSEESDSEEPDVFIPQIRRSSNIIPKSSTTLSRPLSSAQSGSSSPRRTGEAEEVTLDMLNSALGRAPEAPTSSNVVPVEDDTGNKIFLKTRLLGQGNQSHAWTWNWNAEKEFDELKSKLAKIYGTHLSDLTLRFDGETLDDDLCPKNFDMEDEDMIDVEIPKGMFEAAVRAADAYKEDASTSLPPSAPTKVAPPAQNPVVTKKPAEKPRTGPPPKNPSNTVCIPDRPAASMPTLSSTTSTSFSVSYTSSGTSIDLSTTTETSSTKSASRPSLSQKVVEPPKKSVQIVVSRYISASKVNKAIGIGVPINMKMTLEYLEKSLLEKKMVDLRHPHQYHVVSKGLGKGAGADELLGDVVTIAMKTPVANIKKQLKELLTLPTHVLVIRPAPIEVLISISSMPEIADKHDKNLFPIKIYPDYKLLKIVSTLSRILSVDCTRLYVTKDRISLYDMERTLDEEGIVTGDKLFLQMK